jgi:Tfp pilus assembly protein PilF
MISRSYCLFGLISSFVISGCAGLPTGWKEYRSAITCDLEGKQDECDKDYEKAIRKNPQMQGVHASFGTHLLKRGEVQPAQEEYAKEQEFHPVSTTAVNLALKSVSKQSTPSSPKANP